MEKINFASSFIIPCVILAVALIILLSKKDYFGSFISGAKDGAISACKLLPTLCALVVSISIFTSSGACDYITNALLPMCDFLHIPEEIFPLIITRPLSGGASIATLEDILSRCGVDSYEGICASMIMASSDTAIYVISVYFSSTGIKKSAWALPCALFASTICIFLSCSLAKLFF